jgi:predicted O-linked N-acetylglucosamine transferase (SPINDLY family)
VIRAGVPLVSRYGKTMVSRMGLSILTSIGSESMASLNFDAYGKNIQHLKNNKFKIPNAPPPEFSLFSGLEGEG